MQNSGHLSADRWSHALRSDQFVCNFPNHQMGGTDMISLYSAAIHPTIVNAKYYLSADNIWLSLK
jgi:hypothetical protein